MSNPIDKLVEALENSIPFIEITQAAQDALADYKQWDGSRDALVDYIHEALKLRYGEEDRSVAEFIAKNIPATKQKGGV